MATKKFTVRNPRAYVRGATPVVSMATKVSNAIGNADNGWQYSARDVALADCQGHLEVEGLEQILDRKMMEIAMLRKALAQARAKARTAGRQ